MERIVVTGAAGSVGRRVCATLEADVEIDLVAVDRRPGGPAWRVVDLAVDDLKPRFEGASVLVHLASSFEPERDDLTAARADLDITRRVLDAAGAVGVTHVVLLSSAMVYGAWPNNPVPITEAASLRPNPEFAFAAYKAEVERLAHDWRLDHPGTSVTLLRPTTALAEGETSWVAGTLRAAALIEVGDTDPPVQFLHLDDLAEAVLLAVRLRLAGPYNVAPDDHLDGESCRELAGRVPRLHLSEQVARRVAAFWWRHRLAQTPPGIVPYTMHPWVVANEKLRDVGWAPSHTSAEAYVVGTPPRPWAALNAKRRQQLALGGAAVAGLGVVAIGAAIWRRLRSR